MSVAKNDYLCVCGHRKDYHINTLNKGNPMNPQWCIEINCHCSRYRANPTLHEEIQEIIQRRREVAKKIT